ncbi:MAG TPA: hypothetical protein VN239_02900 [Nitrososphaera sp.]|nr:hypothetical protein [Nitrososphaera sp.]
MAESFARMFCRNAFTIGLPAPEIPGIKGLLVQRDQLFVSLGEFSVTNTREQVRTSLITFVGFDVRRSATRES